LRVHHGVLLFIGGTLNLRTLNPFSKKLNQFYRKEFTLSVGNTLGDLRKQYTLTDLITGEGRVAVLVKEIDISFFTGCFENIRCLVVESILVRT
jgi:hypothetical protein